MSNQKALEAKALSKFVAALTELDKVGLTLEKVHAGALKVGDHLLVDGLPYMVMSTRKEPTSTGSATDARHYIALETKEDILQFRDQQVIVVRDKLASRNSLPV